MLAVPGLLLWAAAVIRPLRNWAETGGWLLLAPAISSFLAMNFTGCSTYTSLSGVRREMRFAVPLQLPAAVIGLVLWLRGGSSERRRGRCAVCAISEAWRRWRSTAKCNGCRMCVAVCPHAVFAMVETAGAHRRRGRLHGVRRLRAQLRERGHLGETRRRLRRRGHQRRFGSHG